MPIMDLTGQRFGRLLVTSFNRREKNLTVWNVVCDCGTHKTVAANHLRNGNIVSCGCYRLERMLEHVEAYRVSVVGGEKPCRKNVGFLRNSSANLSKQAVVYRVHVGAAMQRIGLHRYIRFLSTKLNLARAVSRLKRRDRYDFHLAEAHSR